jgi:hypothetical protein
VRPPETPHNGLSEDAANHLVADTVRVRAVSAKLTAGAFGTPGDGRDRNSAQVTDCVTGAGLSTGRAILAGCHPKGVQLRRAATLYGMRSSL